MSQALKKQARIQIPLAEMSALYEQGFSLVPLGAGDNGKSPLVRFSGRKRLPFNTVIQIMQKHQSCVYGLRLESLVVIDCDTDNQQTNEYVKRRFGESNYQVKTPRGRHHYFRGQTKCTSIRHNDIVIDIKSGTGSYVVGSGSIRSDDAFYSHGVCAHNNIIKNSPPLLITIFTKPIWARKSKQVLVL